MSDSDPASSFLSRWSRRKLAARSPQPAPAEPEAEGLAAEAAPQAAATAADLEALPAIEDIVADTDIQAFLKPGVPLALTRSALRRAWSADTVIRDYIGPAEYAWDFNAPGSMAGFGPLAMAEDVREKLVEMLFQPPAPAEDAGGEARPEPEIELASCAVVPPEPRPSRLAAAEAPRLDPAPPETTAEGEDRAPKPSEPQEITDDERPARRPRHGGAMPT